MKTFCTYFNQGICRSCDLIELKDQDQLASKELKLRKLLNLNDSFIMSPSFSSDSLHFRNKAKMVVTGSMDAPIIGLWGEESLDQGREILDCPVHKKELNALFHALKEFIPLAKLAPYSITTKSGELKGLIAYISDESGEVYLRFVLRSEEAVSRIKKFLPTLKEKFPALKVITANIQPLAHAVLEGDKEIFLTDETTLHHKMGSLEFSIGTQGFVQTNQKVAMALYAQAAEWIKELSVQKFTELFCGQGAFSFFCAPFVESGLGIEINEDAVLKANENAQKTFPHMSFLCADAAAIKDKVLAYSPDMILVNPPRRGLGESVKWLKDLKPKMMIYSSCNAETLAKDLLILSDYKVQKIRVFDMFPHTSHFETLVLLQRL